MDFITKTPRKRIPQNTPWRDKVAMNRGRGTEKTIKARENSEKAKKTPKGMERQAKYGLAALQKQSEMAFEAVTNLTKQLNLLNQTDNGDSVERNAILAERTAKSNELQELFIKITAIENRIETVHADNEAVASRVENGYMFNGGQILRNNEAIGITHPQFKLKGFISHIDPILELTLSKTPRGRYMSKINLEKCGKQTLMSGYDKDILSPHNRKILGLDAPMIEWNKSMRGILRVDIDFHFVNIDALIHNINDLGVPSPNLVVMTKPINEFLRQNENGDVLNDISDMDAETITSCHLYWVLRDSICFTENGGKRAKKAFINVLREMTFRLQPIGADFGGLSNPMRGKNPFSPHMKTYIVNKEPYRLSGKDVVSVDNLEALADMMGFCPTYLHAHHKKFLEQADSSAVFDPSCSNSLWDILVTKASNIIEVWKRLAIQTPTKNDIAFEQFKCAMIDFHDDLVATIPDQKTRTKYNNYRTVNRIINHFWENHKARKKTFIPNAGMSGKERQALVGAHQRAQVRLKTLEKLVSSANALQKEMQQDGDERDFISIHEMNKAKLMELTGLSASTCCRRSRLRDVDEIRRGDKALALEGVIVEHLWTDDKTESMITAISKQQAEKTTDIKVELAVENGLPDNSERKKGLIVNQKGCPLSTTTQLNETKKSGETNVINAPFGSKHETDKAASFNTENNRPPNLRFKNRKIASFIAVDDKSKICAFRNGTKQQIHALIEHLFEQGINPIESIKQMSYTRISFGFTVQEFNIDADFSSKRQYIESHFQRLPKHNMFEFRKNQYAKCTETSDSFKRLAA